MGLDQFLLKRKKTRKSASKYFNEIDYEQWKESKIAQWRKANQIHKWFVVNVQDGNDDCGYYKVDKEELIQLQHCCSIILDECKLVDGKVINGFIFDGGQRIPQIVDGKIIDKPEICENILPTQEGFFFGGIDYDNCYYLDVKYTYDILDKIIAETDWDNEEVFYTSSW